MASKVPKKASFTRPLIFILLVAGSLVAARAFNLQEYAQEDRLRQVVTSYGMWGPVIYLLVWTIAPVLMMPCLPVTLAGGILFGPLWGVVYATIGATSGAMLSFLVARYLAREWVAEKISGSKLAHLDDKVARHGWKIVAFTRLIPLLPFFLLNYAFGLTRIRFLPYAIATFFAMLPWTIAFVLLSSSLLPLLQGQVSVWLIIGIVLVALVSLLPVIYKKIKARQGETVEI
jgi:uncharacterized membrane protein YdjX (TVP38/TMEM64 family)